MITDFASDSKPHRILFDQVKVVFPLPEIFETLGLKIRNEVATVRTT